MKYLEPSFSVPPADLRKGTNRHGQTWDDIFLSPNYQGVKMESFSHPVIETPDSVPDATGDSLPHAEPDKTGHMCNGTYKTFSAAHCPYCWGEHGR